MRAALLIAGCLATVPLFAQGDARLPAAARRLDRAGVQRLLAQHVNVNAAEPDGTTALHWAAEKDDAQIAKLLLAAGADAKAANRYGVTPLSLACTNGNADIIEALLQSGAGANDSLSGGESALMTAARTGKPQAVKVLLAHGADFKARETKRGQNALMWAAAEGNVEVVDLLLRAGADPKLRLDSGFTAFLFAVREGRIEVVKRLLQAGADVNDTVGPPPGVTRKSSQHGAPRLGVSALHVAVANAHYELAAFLLNSGANPNAIGPGYTPLHVVTWVRKPGVGDNDPAPDGSGTMTSLEFVKTIVAKGGNINARMTKKVNVGLTSLNTMDATPFLLAARTADAELMRLLAVLGADPKLPNADGATPLIVAAGLGTRSPGEDAGTESEVVEAVQVALDLGNDIDARDQHGETAMHGAAYKNLPAVVELLAARGAKVEVWNQKNSHGWTPLTIAQGYRFGNFKPSFVTIEAFRRIMTAAGVWPGDTAATPEMKR